jgi:predicted transcriptional regulator
MASQYSRESDPPSKSQYNNAFVPVSIGMLNKLQNSSPNEAITTSYVIMSRVEEFNEPDVLFQDETGSIRGKLYKNVHKLTMHAVQAYEFRRGEYACSVGVLKTIDNQHLFIISRITNVASYREVNFHRAQILWSLLIKNNVLKVPELKNEGNAMETDANSEQSLVISFIKNFSRNETRIDDIKRGVRLNPVKIERILRELTDNGYLIESEGFTLFKLA